MYIQKAEIKNIRSIIDFEIEFKNPAGWHVLIGDNGAGKSTVIRSIALALIGETQAQGLRADWKEWINKKANNSSIELNLLRNEIFDEAKIIAVLGSVSQSNDGLPDISVFKPFKDIEKNINASISFYKTRSSTGMFGDVTSYLDEDRSYRLEITQGFFSIAFGPFRRFEGGSSEWDEVYNSPSLANLAAHLSIFNESVALTQPIKWLISLFNTSNDPTLSKKERNENLNLLEQIKKLINSNDFLPNRAKLENVSSKGVFFKDGNDSTIAVNDMSDGYRSVLSMTFELIRQLVRVYGSESVFKNIEKGEMFIDLPGVVLVDEIDAHLHPTWQTRIGQWFLKYFPSLQFIVTTHSPLVCRAAENGSIWRLAAPGSDEKSGEITGLDRERLIYGNILDAYGTGVFGKNTSISEDANEMLNRLSELNVKSMMGLINDKENIELEELRAKFPTEDAAKK